MKIRAEYEKDEPVNNDQFEDFDAWGGAICDNVVYVKDCVTGEIIEKRNAIPYRRGLYKKKAVFYWLKKGTEPPKYEEDLIPSIWEEEKDL